MPGARGRYAPEQAYEKPASRAALTDTVVVEAVRVGEAVTALPVHASSSRFDASISLRWMCGRL
jgi:hypothetical protein